jgi:serine/threonine protein phosphatase PrpC
MTTRVHVPAVEVAQRTDPGRDPEKQVNEDAADYRETRFGHLCVLCDGMGGHRGGKEASNLALASILDYFETADAGLPPAEVLRVAIVEANQRVYAMEPPDPGARPGSTVVAVLLHPSGAEVAHVGDSRVYLIHASQCTQVTKDHSMVQQLVDARMLTPAQAAVHPDANRITRALGMQPEVDVEVRPEPLVYIAGDAFVLCSDGLSDLVDCPEILKVVGAVPPAQAAGQLVDLANARGGHDNITVQILRARESALGMSAPATIAQTIVQTPLPEGHRLGPAPPLSPSSGALAAPPPAVSPTLSDGPATSVAGAAMGPAAGAKSNVEPMPFTAARAALSSGESGAHAAPRPQVPLGVWFGLALAAVALVMAAVAIYVHVSGFGQKPQVPSFAQSASAPPFSPAPSASAVTLSPEPVPAIDVADAASAPFPNLLGPRQHKPHR